MALRIKSKVLVDKGILSGRREEVLLFIVTVLGFVCGDMGKELKIIGRNGRGGGTGNNVGRRVGDVEKGEVLDVVKGGPDKLWRWGARGRSDRRGRSESVGTRTWVIPSVEVRIENLKDGGSGVGDVLLVDVIKGLPGSDRDLGKGGGGDDGGLRSVERHLLNN